MVWVYRLLVNLLRQAEIMAAQGRDAEAIAVIDRAIDLGQTITKQEPGNSRWQSAFISAQNLLVALQMQRSGDMDSPGRFAQAVKKVDELVGINNKDVSLAIVAAHAHRLMALSLWQANRRAEATEHVAGAINMMMATHQAKPTAETQAAFAEVLLTSVELEKAAGKPPGEIEATCLKAQGILAKEALNSTYYRILDPWVRAHACLKQPEKVAQHQARLAGMGYRATEYTRFLSHNPERKL